MERREEESQHLRIRNLQHFLGMVRVDARGASHTHARTPQRLLGMVRVDALMLSQMPDGFPASP